jgi:hypothetical protein
MVVTGNEFVRPPVQIIRATLSMALMARMAEQLTGLHTQTSDGGAIVINPTWP